MNIVSWTPFREMDDIFNRYRRVARSDDIGEAGVSPRIGDRLRIFPRPTTSI